MSVGLIALRRYVSVLFLVVAVTASSLSAARDSLAISGKGPATAVQSQTYEFTPTVSNPSKRALRFTVANRPSWASFNDNTGRLHGTPTANAKNLYSGIVIGVSDGRAFAHTSAFSIKVTSKSGGKSGGSGNHAPTIAGSPSVTVNAGKAYSFKPTASDADGDKLTFAIQGKPVWASFSTTTGALTGKATTAQVGTYKNVMISVSDGKGGSASLAAFAIGVLSASGTSSSNHAPVISGSPATSAVAGSAYSFTPSASDSAGNTLSFSIANKPAWGIFSSITGTLSGKATAGTSSGITISVSDGSSSASLPAFSIVVNAASAGTGGGTTVTSAVAASCATKVYTNGFTPVTGMNTAAQVSSARPARGVVFTEPNYKTCVVRATDHASDGLSGYARNDYSRRQAYNADSSRFLVYAYDGSWYQYDASTLQKIGELTDLGGDAEPQWDATNPLVLYYVPTNGGTVLNSLNVSTGVKTVVGDFSGSKLPWSGVAHVWTKSEGSPSADSRYWCFMAETSNFDLRGIFTWDKQTNTVLGTLTTSELPDHVSMSPSGNHCVVSWDAPKGTYSFSRTMQQERQVHTSSEHSDLAIGANGQDAYVSIDYESANGDVFMVNLETGVRTTLFPTYFNDGSTTAMHISGKAFSRPGWVVISTYMHNNPLHWLHEKVFLVQMAANPKIYDLAHHHRVEGAGTGYNDPEYWSEPQATVNRTLTRINFNSNWEQASSAVEDYMIVLPDGFKP